jgi:hydrophobic/amphiphilic exporter-1 (mainly G- bacteria), HAE1 family
MRVTARSIKRRIATSVIVSGLIVMGVYGLWRLPVNFLPDITYPLIKVYINWRGATPDEIDKNLADPIERIVATIDGLDFIESSTIEGIYALMLNFQYGVAVDTAYQDTLAAMARAARQLPKDIDPPFIVKADPSQLPVVQLTIHSDQLDLVKLRDWAENRLQQQLLSVPGVAGSEIVGGLKREIRVHLDPDAIEKHGLTLTALVARIKDENIEQFGGRVTSGSKEYIARTVAEFKTLDEIRSVVVAREGVAKVTMGDIAQIEDSHEEVRVITRLGGQPCVKLSVLKQADANTVEVAKAVERKIKSMESSLPAGVKLGIVESQSVYVESALRGVRNAAVEAAVLVILVIYFFLGSWRQVVVMLIAMPVTLVVNFGVMKLAGFSLNIFSLGGLVVAIGVVLDNSIVVLENITRLRHANPSETPETIALSGSAEVGPAIVAATLSFLALFVPFLIVPGLTSLLFKELILVIAGIVVISLAVAITLTPMLTAMFLGKGNSPGRQTPFERLFEKITEFYGLLLGYALKGRWPVVVGFTVTLGFAVLLAPKLGSEFLPRIDDGRVMIKVKLPTGASIGETERALRKLEGLVAENLDVESYFTLVGGKVFGLYTYEIANEGEIDIQLVPRHGRTVSTNDYIKKLRPLVSKVAIPGGKAMVMPQTVKGLRKLGDAEIEVKIKGLELDTLFGLARQALEAMGSVGELTNTYISLDMTKPEYQIRVDRTRAAEVGVTMADVANTVRSLITGAVASQYRDGGEYYNIRLVIPERIVTSRRDIEELTLRCSQGGYLRIRDVAEVVPATGPVEIIREDQVKEVLVRADTAGASVGHALAELKQALDGINLPQGYEIGYGGQAQMISDMTKTVLMVLAFAIFFAFIVLAVQFNSLKLPSLILVCVPFCVSGMVYGLHISGLPVGATVVIGALIVVASTVNEGVLLISFAEEIRKTQGLTAAAAALKASKIRLRPRLMISMAIIAGFIPLALNLEEGGDMLQPMAASAIGGVAMGIPVALFLLPCIYTIFTRMTTPVSAS